MACRLDRSSTVRFITALRSWRKQEVKLMKCWQLRSKTQAFPLLFFGGFTCSFFPSLCGSCCEPPVQIESWRSLKLVRNLSGIIVKAIRVIDCLDALSGCIISDCLRPGLGSDPGAKWLKSNRNLASGERIKPLMYDKIIHFNCTSKSSGKRFFISCAESGRTERNKI